MELILKYLHSKILLFLKKKIWGKRHLKQHSLKIRFKTLEKDLEMQYAMNA
jgi:hypothetical protein